MVHSDSDILTRREIIRRKGAQLCNFDIIEYSWDVIDIDINKGIFLRTAFIRTHSQSSIYSDTFKTLLRSFSLSWSSAKTSFESMSKSLELCSCSYKKKEKL